MQAIIAREQTALGQLHARYRPLISKIVLEILPNEADAEEAIQDVFMEIWTRAANFDAQGQTAGLDHLHGAPPGHRSLPQDPPPRGGQRKAAAGKR